MANDKRLTVTEFDFDDVKENLKTFLKAQTQFSDYDFEGSGMNILLDTLAYNTHYLGFNANMLANEMFLDSASLRSSIVSHAKTLGYEVTSCRAPIANINVALTTTNSSATMSAGTTFTTTIDSVSYQFVTISDVTSNSSGSSINFDNIPVYEGTYITTKFIVDTSDIEQRFIIPDNRADTSTLTVKVQTSATDSTTTTFTKATDITQLTTTSNVYYLQEVETGRFEVYFGDGIVSKALSDGNIVVFSYVVTNKTAANGASSFTAPSSIDGVSTIGITTVSNAIGGAEPESLRSIKLQAPLDYASQGRAVTTEDYKVASVTPVIVDVDTTFLILGTTFQYDSNSTTYDVSELESLVNTTISNYNSSDLLDFNSPFRHSKVTGLIDDTDSSILNNITTVTMAKLVTPTTTTSTSYTLNFNNAFYNPVSGYNAANGGIIASTGFYLGGTTEYFFDDDGVGNLRIYSLVQAVRTYFDIAAGTVDYVNGVIKITSVLITSVSNVDGVASTRFRLTVIPNSTDIVPVRNQLLEIDTTNSSVVGSVDATATTGKGYTVSTSGTATTTTTTVSTSSSNPTSSSY